MFKRILVPLDGSSLAERALPLAAHLARNMHASIILVRALNLMYETGVQMVGIANTYITDEVMSNESMSIRAYLGEIKKSEALSGIETRIAAPIGLAADCILDEVQEEHADLIVINSHGYTGFKRWALGSVAEKVARHSPVPVLILHQGDESQLILDKYVGKRVKALVALDGSEFSEASIVPTAQLVAALCAPNSGALHLMRVVKVPSAEAKKEYERTGVGIRSEDHVHAEAMDYLAGAAARFAGDIKKLGVEVTWSVERGYDIADTLVNALQLKNGSGPYSLIAMTTHGRSGLRRWVVGSITEHVLTGTRIPMFVVRPQEAKAAVR